MKRANNFAVAKGVFAAGAVLFALSASAEDLRSNLINCLEGVKPYVTDKATGIQYTTGKFYGYKNAGSGPGPTAFKDAKAWVDEHCTPLVVVFDNGGGNSNTFTADLNDDEDYQGGRYLLQWLNGKAGPSNFNCMFTYFKGSTAAPEACKDAYEFCAKYGASSFPCVVCYWKWPDGTIRTSATGGLSSVGSFEGPVNSFLSKNKPPPTPPYVPPKASAGFAVKDGELKVAPGAEQVYVPFIRTNNFDKAEVNWLISEYPGGSVETNELSWTADRETYREISLALGGRLANAGEKAILVFLNTNQVVVASNSVTCTAVPANSATFPYLPGAVTTLTPGEWSLDAGLIEASSNNVAALRNAATDAIAAYDAATNALNFASETNDLATAAYDAATNALANAVAAYDAATNALYGAESTNETATAEYIVATNALAGAILARDDATSDLAGALVATNTTLEAYIDATNGLVAAVAAYDMATNALYYAGVTNDAAVAAYDAATNALEIATTAYIAASNALEAASSGTPEYDEALANFIAASNTLYYAEVTNETATAAYNDAADAFGKASEACNDASSDLYDASEDVNTTYAGYVAATNRLAEAVLAYDAATNALSYAEVTNETATAAYIAATNALAEAQAGFLGASNTLFYADFTNETATAAYITATNALAEAQGVADATTSEMNDATAALEDAEGKFFLVVCGGILHDNALVALNRDVFSDTAFANWCASKRVAAIYIDVPESATGSSLFSYNVAPNGTSGATFVSLNGLSADQCAALAAQAAEAAEKIAALGHAAAPMIALVRAEGSVCGRLRPQYNADGSCDLTENIERLNELVAQSDDAAEASNDVPGPADGWREAALPELVFGDVVAGRLSVNDTADFILLSGSGWGDGRFAFTVPEKGAVLKAAGLVVDLVRYDAASDAYVVVDGSLSIFATNGVRDTEFVYSVNQADVDNGVMFARVSAYGDEESATSGKFNGASTFAYTLETRPATKNRGVISFDAQPEDPIIQALTNQVVQIPLLRLFGSDEALSVTVSIDEGLTTATNRYEFTEQPVSWVDGEEGVKYVPLTLLGSEFNDGMRDITLRIDVDEAMAGVERYFTTYTISYGKEPTDEGQIAVVSVTPAAMADGRIYVRSTSDGDLHTDDIIKLQVNRTGGKGPAALNIGWKNGKATVRRTISWANYLTGTQTAFLDTDFPEPGSSGYTDVTINLTSSNSVPVVSPSIKVRVLPAESPLFKDGAVAWSGVQYTSTATNLTALALADGMAVKGLSKISGTVPAGLKVSVDTNGLLVVTGVPTAGTVSTTATFWATLSIAGGKLYSMPVTISFENKALADVNDVFAKARSWTGLPMSANDGAVAAQRLAGLLDLAVPKNGKASARYRKAGGKTVSFAAAGLAGVSMETGEATICAAKTAKIGGETLAYALDLTLGADGSMEAVVSCDGNVEAAVALPAGTELWSADNTAARFGGNYVAAFPIADPDNAHSNTLCFGSAGMRFKMSAESAWRRGAVTFAGTLANGKTVSGTAYLVPTTNGAAVASIPVFASSASDTFSAMVDVDGASLVAAEGFVPFWRHDESNIDSLSYVNDLTVFGAVWSAKGWSWSGEKVNVNKTSGMAGGTMRLDVTGSGRLSTISWRGVALPGDSPQILGAYWYGVSKEYGSGKKRTVKAGGLVSLTED